MVVCLCLPCKGLATCPRCTAPCSWNQTAMASASPQPTMEWYTIWLTDWSFCFLLFLSKQECARRPVYRGFLISFSFFTACLWFVVDSHWDTGLWYIFFCEFKLSCANDHPPKTQTRTSVVFRLRQYENLPFHIFMLGEFKVFIANTTYVLRAWCPYHLGY